ncbi:MAG: hypothetical protein C0172_00090 [Caldisphaera sp.]|uniref:hypothetical protein n=1 Tax=Caldisphaera sp. TaxID=2060322 RepID=UPI000CA93B02|nr:MAG: hypothetical protein C0202_02025 [Caldisphaera sp.]PMP89340.1 MAG: hypothetical protein C0172_00090 [Caldisphaera sp.]
MSKKYQELKKTNASQILSIISKLIIQIENTYDDEYNLFDAKVEKDILDFRSLLKKISGNIIELKINTPWEFEDYSTEIDGKEILVKKDPNIKDYISIKDVYNFIPYIPFKTDLDIIKPFTKKTSLTNIEFLFMYDNNGYLSILEGELLKVKIPFIRVVFNMHTHPEGHCGFSVPDINSGLDLLSEGGLATSVVTDSCAIVMHRQGLITENDYIKIKSRKYENEIFDSIKFTKIIY